MSLQEKKIQRGSVIQYGKKGDYPCGVQLVGKDDFGNEGIIDFEFFSCNDLGIKRSVRTGNFVVDLTDTRTAQDYAYKAINTIAGFNPEEVLEELIDAFNRCGCTIKNHYERGRLR